MIKEREVFPDHDEAVVAAVVTRDEGDSKEVLIAQRAEGKAYPLRWELPGGKYDEEDNTMEGALKRELEEELGLKEEEVSVGRLRFHSEYEDRGEGLPLTGFYFYDCTVKGEITIDPDVYAEARWVSANDLGGYDFTPATQTFVDTFLGRNGRN